MSQIYRTFLSLGIIGASILPLYGAGLNYYSDYGVVEQSDHSISQSGSLSIQSDPFGYSDEYTDSESGLQYLTARYYNPVIMRFVSMDTYPLMNRYAYANENPIMNDDPSGHDPVGAEQSESRESKAAAIVGVSLGAVSLILALVPFTFLSATAITAEVASTSSLSFLTVMNGIPAITTTAATVTTGVATLDTHLSEHSEYDLRESAKILDFLQLGTSILSTSIDAAIASDPNNGILDTIGDAIKKSNSTDAIYSHITDYIFLKSTPLTIFMLGSPVWSTISSATYGTYTGVELVEHPSEENQGTSTNNKSNINNNTRTQERSTTPGLLNKSVGSYKNEEVSQAFEKHLKQSLQQMYNSRATSLMGCTPASSVALYS